MATSRNKGSKNRTALPESKLIEVLEEIDKGTRIVDIIAITGVSKSVILRLKSGNHYYIKSGAYSDRTKEVING